MNLISNCKGKLTNLKCNLNKNRIYIIIKARLEVKVNIISQKTRSKIFKEVNQQLKKVIVLLCEIIFLIN